MSFFGMDCYTKRKLVFPSGQEVEGGKNSSCCQLKRKDGVKNLWYWLATVLIAFVLFVCIPRNKQAPLLPVNHCGIFCSLEGLLFENGPLVNSLFYFHPETVGFCVLISGCPANLFPSWRTRCSLSGDREKRWRSSLSVAVLVLAFAIWETENNRWCFLIISR